MPDIEHIRGEIERMRHRSTGSAARSSNCSGPGIPTASADALLNRMLDKIDALCAERDQLKKRSSHGPTKGKAVGGRNW